MFCLYNTALNKGLVFNLYDPDESVSYQEITTEKGSSIAIKQTGNTGNLSIQYPERADLSDWLRKRRSCF